MHYNKIMGLVLISTILEKILGAIPPAKWPKLEPNPKQ
jgi:hypothetical protein